MLVVDRPAPGMSKRRQRRCHPTNEIVGPTAGQMKADRIAERIDQGMSAFLIDAKRG